MSAPGPENNSQSKYRLSSTPWHNPRGAHISEAVGLKNTDTFMRTKKASHRDPARHVLTPPHDTIPQRPRERGLALRAHWASSSVSVRWLRVDMIAEDRHEELQHASSPPPPALQSRRGASARHRSFARRKAHMSRDSSAQAQADDFTPRRNMNQQLNKDYEQPQGSLRLLL